MATDSSRRTPSVGGKHVKNRRLKKTPYSRPSPSPLTTNSDNYHPENPNWLSGLIYPAKFIASGAGKLLSFFGNYHDDDSSSTSSANDSSENDDEIENDILFQEDDQLDKVLSSSSKSDSKRAIEQLVMQEMYSRKEANKLTKLVRSRIVDTGGIIGETTPNIRSTAIMEARKWLQEKRSGSKKTFEDELDRPNILRSEKGSPVDMARSYMQSRPAWASPTSLKQFNAGSSSPVGMLDFKEETPKSTLHSSELKTSSFTSGSWNLLDEIRRVHSKATEELLAAAPLTKPIPSLFTTESNQPRDTMMNTRLAEGAGLKDSTHDRSENVMRDASTNDPSRVSQYIDAGQSVEHQDSKEAAVLKYNNNEMKQLKSTQNGFGCSASGLADVQDATHEARPSEEENGNLVDLSVGGHDIHMVNLNRQEEPLIDIPTDTVINGSQNSYSMQDEDLSQDFSQPVAKDGPPAKAKHTQKERKMTASTRRGRRQGK